MEIQEEDQTVVRYTASISSTGNTTATRKTTHESTIVLILVLVTRNLGKTWVM